MRRPILIPDTLGKPFDVRTLFELIPDEIVLATALRDFEMYDGTKCLCAWLVREAIARTLERDPERIRVDAHAPIKWSVPMSCEKLFGGEDEQWQQVFYAVSPSNDHNYQYFPQVERAWVDRVDLAVTRSNGGSDHD